ncbi:hypothetical protein [Pseudomonas sp. RW10S2]|uniref:lipopolysaccharide biosynthesis protein n=1 Tax=Pseudomonas sp. RW10S2 TaxID=459637 RepID=UPI001644EAB0|nr:hypothetical protein [Pseudomonas sp. RW10S2]MBC3465576.1 hypothetical protein [Pseudomonas sp. RW10S2]
MDNAALKVPQSIFRLVNVALRGMTLGSKFLLIFLLAHFLAPSEVGLYGLIAAAISYALYLLGFDFYTYSTRELLKREPAAWGGVLKSQAALSGVLYMIFLPLLGLLFVWGLLPWRMSGWFFILLVLEHVNQEAFRIFIAASQPLRASVLLCLRSGAWALVIAMAMAISPELRSLKWVLMAWGIGGVSALLLGACWLRRMPIQGWRDRVDWRWILRGLKVALPLVSATLALRALSTLDRYWFEYLGGLDVLGAYVLFAGISSALMAFLDAGVFSFVYPALIKAWQQGDATAFRLQQRQLLQHTVVLSGVFCCVSLLAIEPLLTLLDKPIYLEHVSIFPWLLAASVLYGLGMVPHYALYAQGHDRSIIYSHLFSVLVFAGVTLVASRYSHIFAVPLGVVAAFTSILLWKTARYFQLTPKRLLPATD